MSLTSSLMMKRLNAFPIGPEISMPTLKMTSAHLCTGDSSLYSRWGKNKSNTDGKGIIKMVLIHRWHVYI